MDDSNTLCSLFEAQVTKNPHHTAVISSHQTLTYEQLNLKANQLAHYLMDQGVRPDALVALYCERSIDFLVAVLGILKAGGAYIPLDSAFPYERISLILKGAGNPLLITSEPLKKDVRSYAGPVVVLSDNNELERQPTYNPDTSVTTNHLAYVIYTSGSTGTPKGVLIEHGSVINYTSWFSKQCFDINRVDFSSNPAFDLAVTLYLTPLLLGATVVVCSDTVKKDPRRYLKHLNNYAIDFIKLTPSYFKVLSHETVNKPVTLPQLKRIMLGGERLSKSECSIWLSQYPHHILYNEYGPTETTVATTVFAINKDNINDLDENIPIGELATNTYAYLLDKQLNPVADGEVGELYLGGLCLARGYLNSPELTERYFIKDPFSKKADARLYKTGDLCRCIDKQFDCLGRIDHQIKIRGFRIELSEIEHYLALYPAVKEVVVIASNHPQQENHLIAYYLLKEHDPEPSSRELTNYLKRYVPEYMIPTFFIRLDAFPLNANDKLDRNALPNPQLNPNKHFSRPARSALERTVVDIWSKELNCTLIGVKDDFFELGGHSLSAARIISKINHEFKIDLYLRDFYDNPTVFSLVSIIKKTKRSEGKQMKLSRQWNDNSTLLPLSDFQFTLWMADLFEPKAKKLNVFTRRRFQGRLELQKFNKAIDLLIHKHEVLSYHISKFRPTQYLIDSPPPLVKEESLVHLSEQQRDVALDHSARELMNHYPWPNHAPPIKIRLFYLNGDQSEVQLCIPHIISDDLCPEIVLKDLSMLYQNTEESSNTLLCDRSYRQYLFKEQSHFNTHLMRNINFWDDYLKDAYLYSFPTEYVIKNMRSHNYSYSTYIELPEKNLIKLSSFCAKKHVTLLDGLCAVSALALNNCSPTNNNYSICINRVKSTREEQDYDETIGCFLGIEPIKLALNESCSFSRLSQEIHQAAIDVNPYQKCPDLIKLASIATFKKRKRIIKPMAAKIFFWFYSFVAQSRFYYKTLRVVERLHSAKNNNFLININLQSNFFRSTHGESKECLFGFKEQKTAPLQHDLLEIDNVFDVTFVRQSNSADCFVVISANLVPHYREKIGHEMLRILNEEVGHG